LEKLGTIEPTVVCVLVLPTDYYYGTSRSYANNNRHVTFRLLLLLLLLMLMPKKVEIATTLFQVPHDAHSLTTTS